MTDCAAGVPFETSVSSPLGAVGGPAPSSASFGPKSRPVTPPIGMVLVWLLLRTLEVTSTSMSHLPLAPAAMAAGITPPVREIVPVPTVAVTVPWVAKADPSPATQL